MVQMAYFGDDRDFFKHDLISWIVKKDSFLPNLVYVPTLTHPRNSKEGNVPLKNKLGRSEELHKFIKNLKTLIDNNKEQKSLKHWQGWYKPRVANYHTLEPVDEIFFTHEQRSTYWEKFQNLLSEKNSLVFVDPDTGLETRDENYMRRQGFDKYLLNKDLRHLYDKLHDSSVLMIYQHLPNNANQHVQQAEGRVKQLIEVCGQQLAIAYREHDLAFLFIVKTDEVFEKLQACLQAYHDKSRHEHRTLITPP